LHSHYAASQHENGQKCPSCKTVIFTKVPHPKTGKLVCPVCGK
jgi:uncharacterized Zn finger protein (UPF0148 family)